MKAWTLRAGVLVRSDCGTHELSEEWKVRSVTIPRLHFASIALLYRERVIKDVRGG